MSPVDVDSIRAGHIGETIQLRGIVQDIGKNMIAISSAVYCCPECSNPYTVQNEVPYGKLTIPKKCSYETGCGQKAKSGFKLDEDQSTFIDFRTIQLHPVLDRMGKNWLELVVTDMETSINLGDEIVCEAQIRSNITKGHLVIPYAFSDNINPESVIPPEISTSAPTTNTLVRSIIRDICSEGDGTANLTEIYNRASVRKISETTIDDGLTNLRMSGEVFSPRRDVYQFAR
jgi:DNA replicative helicase MCM subunit Mcm2 (Cdc46/Mcm family)